MRAIILFTRVPIAGKTKTRMQPYLSEKECAKMHKSMLKDIYKECKSTKADIFVCYTPYEERYTLLRILDKNKNYIVQRGKDIGERMYNAIKDVLELGYESCVLIGSDIAELKKIHIDAAFKRLEYADIVFGKTVDGGYYLVGMKKAVKEVFEVEKYGNNKVFENTLKRIESIGFKVGYTKTLYDIDIKEDLAFFRHRIRKYGLKPARNYKNIQKRNLGKFAMDNLKISIVIPIYNEEKTVLNLQNQLKEFYNDCEIIFVDGGSTDNTLNLINKKYTLIHSRKGRANQMNSGAKKSTGDVIFFLHCDSILPKNFMGEIKEVMKNHEFGCFGIKFRGKKSLLMSICALISNHRAAVRKIAFGDQGIFIDRELFFLMGGFEDIPIMEDYNLSLRLKEKNIKLGMTKSYILTSERRFSGNSIEKLKLMWKMNRLRKMYRDNVDIEKISALYSDKR